MKLTDFYLQEHATVHSRAVAIPESGFALEDLIYANLSDDMARRRPRSDVNSIAWLTWHMARCEDVAMNVVIAGEKQLLESDGWGERLGVNRSDICTGMSDDEVGEFTEKVEIAALRAYRAAVGRRTRQIVDALEPSTLARSADPAHVERAFAEGAVGDGGRWVAQFWQGKTIGWFLWLGTGHNFMHLGEANLIRTLVGADRGR